MNNTAGRIGPESVDGLVHQCCAYDGKELNVPVDIFNKIFFSKEKNKELLNKGYPGFYVSGYGTFYCCKRCLDYFTDD